MVSAYETDADLKEDGFLERLQRSLKAEEMIIEALEVELASYDANELGFASRAKFIWNEDNLKDLQPCVMDQAISLGLLL